MIAAAELGGVLRYQKTSYAQYNRASTPQVFLPPHSYRYCVGRRRTLKRHLAAVRQERILLMTHLLLATYS